jgi:hypothetical protein
MTTPSAIRRLEEEVGALIEQHRRRTVATDFTRYANDPVGFIRDVLHGAPWATQVAIAESVRDARQTVVRGCNGSGKDWLAGRLALWWVYARQGTVLITGPTARQVKEVVMGQIRRSFRPELPGELFEMALRVRGEAEAGILAFTSTDVSRLTGFHAPRLLVIITEAQGCESGTWEAAYACATGEDSKLLAVGNPLTPAGAFFEACRSVQWVSHRVSAFDHPNLVQGREVIPGAVTQGFVDSIRTEYGEASGVYRARVLAEFPDESDESLVQRSWLSAAAERWDRGDLERKSEGQSHVGGLDPARFGADHTALAIRQGPILRHLVTWSQADTMVTCGRLHEELDRLGLSMKPTARTYRQLAGGWRVPVKGRDPTHVAVTVDEVGVGGGVLDRLKELKLDATGFNGGRSPTLGQEGQFANLRAESYWGLRRLLEAGLIALPRDEKLFDELAGMRWRVNSSGKVAIEAKDDMRARLGRSPDRADAVAMAFLGVYQPPRQGWRTFKVGI